MGTAIAWSCRAAGWRWYQVVSPAAEQSGNIHEAASGGFEAESDCGDGGKYEREETIGPVQVEGDRLWFGNSFYDGEGMRGVGTFGYFDAATRQYRLFSPQEVAPYEVSAILVEREVVWVALDVSTEDISRIPGGLVEWNRRTHAVRKYPAEFLIDNISREGDSLRVGTNGGYALLTGGSLHRFRVANGITTAIDRFPKPPSSHE